VGWREERKSKEELWKEMDGNRRLARMNREVF
jgi:hypothetical protein